MIPYQISNKDAKTLSRVVSSSEFKSSGAVLRYLIQNHADELIQPQEIVIDLQPAQHGKFRIQEQWVALYNAQEGEFKGKRMISSPDMIGTPEIASPEALASLQKDCIDRWVVTSTHNSFIPYQRTPLAGDVIHNYQSSVVRPKLISLDEIPVLRGESARIIERKDDFAKSTLRYLRALADDRYVKPITLLKRLSTLAQREPEDIALWTPSQSSRQSIPERDVRFYGNDVRFHVDGDSIFDSNVGHSRGVLINPRSGRAKK